MLLCLAILLAISLCIIALVLLYISLLLFIHSLCFCLVLFLPFLTSLLTYPAICLRGNPHGTRHKPLVKTSEQYSFLPPRLHSYTAFSLFFFLHFLRALLSGCLQDIRILICVFVSTQKYFQRQVFSYFGKYFLLSFIFTFLAFLCLCFCLCLSYFLFFSLIICSSNFRSLFCFLVQSTCLDLNGGRHSDKITRCFDCNYTPLQKTKTSFFIFMAAMFFSRKEQHGFHNKSNVITSNIEDIC